MKNRYPVVTLCGSAKFADEFARVQEELIEDGKIVLYDGLFYNSGNDSDAQEARFYDLNFMLIDMQKQKIDMSDEIFVVNPKGYIDEYVWSEICYAEMTGKQINSIVPISKQEIENKVKEHIELAESLAAKQYDVWSHLSTDYPKDDCLLSGMAYITKNKTIIIDPWVPDDESVEVCDIPYPCHAAKSSGYDPFKQYGKKEMARFVEDILLIDKLKARSIPAECKYPMSEKRKRIMEEIELYCRELGMSLPDSYPDEMSDKEMERWIEIWDDYDPCPDV